MYADVCIVTVDYCALYKYSYLLTETEISTAHVA